MSLVKYNRRIPEVLIAHWDHVRGDRPFPNEEELDIDSLDVLGFWEDCFIVQTHDIARGKDYNYIYVGSNIIKAYGEDLTGVSVHSFTSPQADNLALKYQEVLATQVPIINEGDFVNAKNIRVRYRQCLVPLGRNGKVDTIIGAMRYKMYPGG
jgi:hypothetical protein